MDKKIRTNAIFNLVYQITVIIIPLITIPYISRVLGPENIGIQSYTLSIVSYFTLFAAFGLNDYGQREIARFQTDKNKVSKLFWEIITNRLLTTIIIIIVYLGTVFIFLEPYYEIYYLILIFNILAVTFDITWLFQGLENFKSLAIRNMVIKILSAISIFVFIKNESDLVLYVFINSMALIISSLSIWFLVPKYISIVRIRLVDSLKHFRGSLVYFIPAIAIQIYTILDKSMIQWITGSNTENGVYDQAEKIVKVSLTLIQFLNVIMRSRVSFLYENNRMDEAKELCDKSLRFLSLFMYPMCFGCILVAPNLIPLYLGTGYDKSVILMQIFSLLIIFIGISGFVGSHYMTPSGQQGKSNIALITGSCINFLLNMLLIPRFGSVGACIASVIAEGIIAFLYVYNARNFIAVGEYFRCGYKNLISALVMLIGTYLITMNMHMEDWIMLVTKFFIAVGIYGLMIIILKDETAVKVLNKIVSLR